MCLLAQSLAFKRFIELAPYSNLHFNYTYKMKHILIILALIGLLTACESQSQPRKKTKTIRIVETNEKANIIDAEHYSSNDTVIVYYTHVGTENHWKLDQNWLSFNELSHQEPGFPRYYKAVIQ